MTYYVAGGLYQKNDDYYFALVNPGSGLPYVWTDPLPHRTLTEHHAHLYRLDGDTLRIHRRGDNPGPDVHVLTPEQLRDVRARIESGEVYNEAV